MTRTLTVWAAFALASLGGGAYAADGDITEQTLDNGLKIVVREDHRAPVVVSQIWYRVGSSYEDRPITGVSHVLEHMMFKGTENYEPGEFSAIIAREGGRQNAFTARDYTTYFEQLASDRLEIAFELEADRMHNLRLDPEEFEKELQVVIEERRLRIDDVPLSRLGERFAAVAYPASPYGHPIIGWRSDLEGLRLADLQRWYQQWYVPGNAILVVAGDVDPEAVFELSQEHFGDIPAREPADTRGDDDLDAPGERRFVMRDARTEVPHLVMGYETPSGGSAEDTADVYALMVLAAVLDGGAGARLPQILTRDRQIAASVGASYDGVARLDSRFILEAAPAPGQEAATLERALREQVARLRQQPPSEAELERAKNQLLADYLFRLDSTFYQAMQIGMLEATGIGWEVMEGYEDAVRAVTAADVRAVAQRYLTADRLTTAVILPENEAEQGDDT